jgi:hypothetical protein
LKEFQITEPLVGSSSSILPTSQTLLVPGFFLIKKTVDFHERTGNKPNRLVSSLIFQEPQ